MVAKTQTKRTESKAKSLAKTQKLSIVIYDTEGKKKSTMVLPSELFDVAENPALIAQVVRVYQANQRQGGARAQTRGEVTGSRRKIWRQKGTGRARHGDRYAPIFVGGGVAHGPKTRDFQKSINKKMRRRALACVLTKKYKENSIIVVDGIQIAEPKTKKLVSLLSALKCTLKQGKLRNTVLLTTPKTNEQVYRAGRNVSMLTIRPVTLLNAYDVLRHKMVIFDKQAVTIMQKAFAL